MSRSAYADLARLRSSLSKEEEEILTKLVAKQYLAYRDVLFPFVETAELANAKAFKDVIKITGQPIIKGGKAYEGTFDNLYKEIQKGDKTGFMYAVYCWLHMSGKGYAYAVNVDEALISFKPSLQSKIIGFRKKHWPADEFAQFHENGVANDQAEETSPSNLLGLKIHTVSGECNELSASNFETIPLRGREEEIESLNKFADDSRGFCLWAVVAPSGAGKTRLVNEWAYQLQETKGWIAGNITNINKSFDWEKWVPKKPTLLIIDYIFGYDAVIQSIITRMLILHSMPSMPTLRLLLLDNIAPKKIFDLLNNTRFGFHGHEQSLTNVSKYFFSYAPLNLTETKNQNKIIRALLCQMSERSETDTIIVDALEHMRAESGLWQPLFSILMGLAIKETGDYTKLNRRELIKQYLAKNSRLTWLRQDGDTLLGKWAGCFNAAATAVRGAEYRDLLKATLNNTQQEVNVALPNATKIKDLCNSVVANSSKSFLKAFEPDILGETHFLIFLEEVLFNSVEYEGYFSQLICAGDVQTQLRNTEEFIAFFTRLARNLANEDQKAEQTKEYWNVVQAFLKADFFLEDSPFRWAQISTLYWVSNTLKNQQDLQRSKEFLHLINENDLYLQMESKESLHSNFDL